MVRLSFSHHAKIRTMLLKPAPETPPIFGRRNGSVFTFGRIGQVMKNLPATALHRTASQRSKMQFIMSACRHWRNVGEASLAAWAAWVAFSPQHTVRSSAVFLDAYQNFIKRNYYFQLFRSDFSQWLLNPALVTYEPDPPLITITLSAGVLLLNATFARNDSTIEYFISVSQAISTGVDFSQNNNRLQIMTLNNSGSFDITARFISAFGKLPAISAILFCSFVGCGVDNGQFFFEQEVKTEVTAPETGRFGKLFNHSAIYGTNSIIAENWRLLTSSEWQTLIAGLGGRFVAGSHMKSLDTTLWLDYQSQGDNSTGLSLSGAGLILTNGSFVLGGQTCDLAALLLAAPELTIAVRVQGYNYECFLHNLGNLDFSGLTCRPAKIDEGETEYIGNDGQVYEVCRFGGFVFVSQPLKETKLRDGTPVFLATSPGEWITTEGPKSAWPNYDPNY